MAIRALALVLVPRHQNDPDHRQPIRLLVIRDLVRVPALRDLARELLLKNLGTVHALVPKVTPTISRVQSLDHEADPRQTVVRVRLLVLDHHLAQDHVLVREIEFLLASEPNRFTPMLPQL